MTRLSSPCRRTIGSRNPLLLFRLTQEIKTTNGSMMSVRGSSDISSLQEGPPTWSEHASDAPSLISEREAL